MSTVSEISDIETMQFEEVPLQNLCKQSINGSTIRRKGRSRWNIRNGLTEQPLLP
jgi:hypothetical protein